MPNDRQVIIRKFEPKDRGQVRKIIYDAALMGEPASFFFDGEKNISDALSLYYTDYEPESCFVAESDGAVVGCLIGTKSKVASDKVISQKIFPQLLRSAFFSGVFFKKKNLVFFFNLALGILRGEFKTPDFAKDYPALLHINIDKGFRNNNIGSRLISAYLNYLKQESVCGVHLATMSDSAGKFFSKQGFELLHSGKRSYFRHILHRDVPLYIYGKKLNQDRVL